MQIEWTDSMVLVDDSYSYDPTIDDPNIRISIRFKITILTTLFSPVSQFVVPRDKFQL